MCRRGEKNVNNCKSGMLLLGWNDTLFHFMGIWVWWHWRSLAFVCVCVASNRFWLLYINIFSALAILFFYSLGYLLSLIYILWLWFLWIFSRFPSTEGMTLSCSSTMYQKNAHFSLWMFRIFFMFCEFDLGILFSRLYYICYLRQ